MCSNTKGAIAVEYALISALIVIVMLFAMVSFADTLLELWLETSSKLLEVFSLG